MLDAVVADSVLHVSTSKHLRNVTFTRKSLARFLFDSLAWELAIKAGFCSVIHVAGKDLIVYH